MKKRLLVFSVDAMVLRISRISELNLTSKNTLREAVW